MGNQSNKPSGIRPSYLYQEYELCLYLESLIQYPCQDAVDVVSAIMHFEAETGVHCLENFLREDLKRMKNKIARTPIHMTCLGRLGISNQCIAMC